MAETKATKKTTTTKKVATPKKTPVKKAVSKKDNITINDIPTDIIAQLTQQITQQVTEQMNSMLQKKVIPPTETRSVEPSSMAKNINYGMKYLNSIRDEEIEVMSLIDNPCRFICKHYRGGEGYYSWGARGDIELIPVGDIITMERNSKRFLHEPWLLIKDERVLKSFRDLEKIQKMASKLEDLSEFVRLPEKEIEEVIETINSSCKADISRDLHELQVRDELDISFSKKEFIEKLLGRKF